jgi:two-component system chemotaxis response regulator CheY
MISQNAAGHRSARREHGVMLRVLVVDDSAVMRRMVARSLELSGLGVGEVFEASDGEEALEVVRRAWIDVVLCDVHMPKMDGVELVRRMSEDLVLSDLPVVVISSDRTEGRASELGRLGIRGYVHKPFQPETIGRVVRQVLGLEEAS